jgi:hypothetical protein
MSPNNVILHFPPNFPDKVYIDSCDWAMAGNFNDLKKSLYIHKNEDKSRIMQQRWWVAPELNHVLPLLGSTRDVNFNRRPKFTPKNETFAVDKIAKAIYSGNLSLEYYNRYVKEDKADDVYSHASMNQVFKLSLEQLFKEDLEQRDSLNQIVNRYMGTPFNWLVPNVGDML